MHAGARAARRSSWDLLHHGLVGGILGIPLSVWLTGLLYHLSGSNGDPAKYQVAMWTVVPLWTVIASLSLLADSRSRLWLVMGAANTTAGALVYLVAR